MNSFAMIIPIYNTDKYLRRCLESVSEIDHPIHVIMVDDGSTDSCPDICDEYSKKDSRFTVIHQQNKGVVEARKAGIRAVEETYFTFIDSDDHIDPTEYTKVLREYALEKQDADIICLGMTEEYMGTKTIKYNKFPEGKYDGHDLEMIRENMLSFGSFFDFGILPNTVCKLFRTQFVRSCRYSVSPDVRIGEDADMTYQLLLKANSVNIINMAPYHYLRREDSMMWKKADTKAIECLEKDLKAAFEAYDNDRMMEQLKDYMNFIRLFCAPELLLGELDFFKNKNEKIALYGAGGVGKAVRNSLHNEFTLWVDRNADYYNSNQIAPITDLTEKSDRFDKVFIAIANVQTCAKVKEDLIKMGINKPVFYFGMPTGD